METVKIVFDIDTASVKTSTDDLKALNKVTETEIETLKRLEAESNASKVAFSQLSKEIKSANTELVNVKKQFGDTSKEAQSAQKNVDTLTDKMAELKNTVKPLDEAFVSLRTQVKQAKEEAQKAADKYGEFSKEANNARQKAGLLADQMGDLNRQVSLLNPEAKAKAFSNLGGAVVGAFSVATGALQAFGVKNKEVEELAMKLQGALNITQGIASFGALKESLADIKVVLGFTTAAQEGMTLATGANVIVTQTLTAAEIEAAAAQKALNASMATNPIFLAVAAIGALVGAYILLNAEQNKNILNEKELAELKKKTVDLKNKEKQTAIDLLVATKEISKQEGERRKIELKRLEDTDELSKKTKTLTQDQIASNAKLIQFEKDAKELRADAAKERDPELRKALQANASSAESQLKTEREKNAKIKQSNQALQEQLNTINKTSSNERTQQDIDELNSKEDTDKKILASNEAAAAKNKQLRDKEAADKEKAFQDELKLIQLRQKNQVDDASSIEEKLALQQQFAVENFQLELNHLQQTGATVTQLQTLWETYYGVRTGLSAQQDKVFQDSCEKQLKAQKDFIDKMKAISDKELSPVEKIQAENDAIDTAYADQYAAAVKNGDDTAKITEAYLKAVAAQQKKLTDVVVSEDEKRKKSGEDAAMARYNKEKAAMDRTIQATNELFNALSSIQAANYNQETIDAQKQKEAGLISEEEYQKKLKELKHRQDVADKNGAIFKATLDFAAALINALKAPPLAVPAQLAFVAAIAGLNLAKIIATPLPKYQKGTLSVPGMDMGRDSVQAMLQPGEAVIPTATNRAYHPTIKAIYEKKISPSEINNFVMSRTKGSSSSTNMTASIDTYALGRVLGKNKGVQIENANLVGKAIARELGNRFNARQTL